LSSTTTVVGSGRKLSNQALSRFAAEIYLKASYLAKVTSIFEFLVPHPEGDVESAFEGIVALIGNFGV
jgi:hypothetical protein